MAQEKVQAPLRILNLALNLLNTRHGLTRTDLMRLVAGYQAEDEASAQRMFERDIEHLRRAGLVVEVRDRFHSEATYRVSTSSFPSQASFLSEREVALLLRAVDSWEGSGAVVALRNKLRGYTSGAVEIAAHPTRFVLESADGLDIVQTAIAQRRPISFDYVSKSGSSQRSVAPWQVIARGRALYLWGFDLDAWAPRLFRFSRLRSAPKLTGEAGAVDPEGPLEPVPFDPSTFLIEPELLVRSDSAPITRAHSTPELDDLENGDDPSWQRRRGVLDDAGVWEERALLEADSVRILSPDWLKKTIDNQLETARDWTGESDG
ncbi:helix-turn-helix transcriptional regulator [Actinomyces minihominis]|uniref:helix-turn-helix transcriptional regulator n=1 Tax=Actinomyces minihominis TaxID=2002838 RepID=UPI0013ECB642|nr:WYL domain-containing protein [Actinomyces minihominis]